MTFSGIGNTARAMGTQKRQPQPIDDRMAEVQQLAYDAERWPHCMDVKTSSRHSG